MSDLKQYIDRRKKIDKEFAEGYEEGYEQFKIGAMLRHARESVGLTQEELALKLNTRKTAAALLLTTRAASAPVRRTSSRVAWS